MAPELKLYKSILLGRNRTVIKTDPEADGVGMKGNRQVIDETFVKQLNEGGCNEFHVWTVDQINDAAYFKNLGAFGITTNKPALIGTIRSKAK